MLDSVMLDGTKFDNAILGSAMFDSAMQCCTTLSLNAQICGFYICKFANCNPAISSNTSCLNAAHTIGCFFGRCSIKVKSLHFNVIPKVILIKLQIAGRAAGARSHFVRTRSVHEGLLATAHRDLARQIQKYKDTKTQRHAQCTRVCWQLHFHFCLFSQ